MFTHHSTSAPLASVRRQGPPFSSLRERPLSIASTLSAVSFLSEASTSSALANTGERRRRSAVLLELDVDDATRSSLRRAEQALRASEQDRQWDVRRASWRERQGRSLHFLEHLPGAGEVEVLEGAAEVDTATTAATSPAGRLKRFSPQRLLYKTRSVPSSIALSADGNVRPISPIISAPRRKSPSPPKAAAPRRSASTANLLSTESTAVRSSGSSARPISPPRHEHFGTLPLRMSHLPPPQCELPSKFSASSGDSMVHVVSFGADADKPRRGFRDRARTFSQVSAGGLKSLKGKVGRSRSMRTKQNRSSLANLFAGLGGSSDEGGAEQAGQRGSSFAEARPAATSSGTSGRRPSTSISSYAPSSAAATSDSGRPSRKPSRLGFFRSTLKRDSSSSKRNSVRTRSSGQVSPALISRPVSLSTSDSFSPPPPGHKRSSEVSASALGVQDGDIRSKAGWATRLSKAVKGKNVAAKRALFEGAEVVQHAQKVKVSTTPLLDSTARAPSRIPLSTVFPHAAAPARPPRPSKNLESSDDTTFYGHRIPAVKSRAAALEALVIQTSARRVRPKSSVPVAAKPRVSPPPPMPPFQARPRDSAVDTVSCSADALLPPAPIYPAHSFSSRRHSPDSFDLTDSSLSPADQTTASFLSSSDDDRCASPARSFRSPSPARFRDLLPSVPAGSSPEKNERGLPMPQEASPKSMRREDSPKKRAMGPEQVILMEDAKQQQGPFTELCGATTDLADLLSGLEDTEDFNTSRQVDASRPTRSHIQHDVSDLSASLRGQLPHVDSIESLRSSISDVPVDLKQLINAVDDHISEVDVPHVVVETIGLAGRGFADEDLDSSSYSSSSSSSSGSGSDDDDRTQDDNGMHGLSTYASHHNRAFLSVIGEHTTGILGSDGGLTTSYDVTASSFEGHYSTAAAALRSMLAGPELGVSSPPESATLRAFPPPASATLQAFQLAEIDEEPRSTMRDSLREALELGRPSNGERMFYEVDDAVPLSALEQSVSPPASPEASLAHAREAAFLRHHLRSASGVSSSEGTGESLFSMMGSPTPMPASGRPVRQSLARYSQDRFPVKRPSHRARPISEQSSMSSSEQDQNSSEQTTSSIAAPSTRSTNLSVSSVTSSPCPGPGRRRIPMLTSNALPLPSQPAFRFPPPKGSAVAEQTREWVKSESGEVGLPAGSTSPRYVRSLERSSPGDPPPRPHLLDLDTDLVSPDTPPPSSPSDGELHGGIDTKSSRSSLEVVQPPIVNVERRARHGRQTSRSSSIMQSIIVEEAESPSSPSRPVSVELRAYLQPLSPIQEPPSPQTVPHGPLDDSPSVCIELPKVDHLSAARIIDLEPHDEFDFTAETNPELTSRYFSFTYEAETELKRSPALWPDTDYSREVLAHWLIPRTYHAILEFIFYSQTRFPSPPHLVRLSSWVPLAFDDPPTPPSPIRIPPPIVDSPPDVVDVVLTTRAAPVRRKPLGAKAVNRQVAELSKSTSSPSKQPKEDLSPFTALPPRLSSKLRGLRGAKAVPAESPKKVDTGFLGDNATRRRQGQFNAAMRKLEGVGVPAEQRSDEETDDTGVLEAKGEATEELSFTKTPRLSAIRPKVRRKAGLASMR